MTEQRYSAEEFSLRIQQAFGSELVGIVLYGSAAAPGAAAAGGDQNILVLVRESVAHAALSRASTAVREWGDSGQPPPLIFTLEEWRRSADVYPMEYADVLQQHRVLFGELDVTATRVKLKHLRLQLEQEILGKLLRFRQGISVAGESLRERNTLLQMSFGGVRVILRGLVRLHREVPPADTDALVRSAARCASVEPEPLLRMASLAAGKGQLAPTESVTLVSACAASLALMLAHVDRFHVSSDDFLAVSQSTGAAGGQAG